MVHAWILVVGRSGVTHGWSGCRRVVWCEPCWGFRGNGDVADRHVGDMVTCDRESDMGCQQAVPVTVVSGVAHALPDHRWFGPVAGFRRSALARRQAIAATWGGEAAEPRRARRAHDGQSEVCGGSCRRTACVPNARGTVPSSWCPAVTGGYRAGRTRDGRSAPQSCPRPSLCAGGARGNQPEPRGAWHQPRTGWRP